MATMKVIIVNHQNSTKIKSLSKTFFYYQLVIMFAFTYTISHDSFSITAYIYLTIELYIFFKTQLDSCLYHDNLMRIIHSSLIFACFLIGCPDITYSFCGSISVQVTCENSLKVEVPFSFGALLHSRFFHFLSNCSHSMLWPGHQCHHLLPPVLQETHVD